MVKKFIALFLCICIGIMFMPFKVLAANMQQGTPINFKVNDDVDVTSKIVFGGQEWYVVGNGTVGETSITDTATLLATTNSKTSVFRIGNATSDNSTNFGGYWIANNPKGMQPWSEPTEYAGSALQEVLQRQVNNLNQKESALINARNFVSSNDYTTSGTVFGPSVSNQKYWPLSYDETMKLNIALKSNLGFWWLRYGQNLTPELVYDDGSVGFGFVTDSHGVRPAFNLNLNSVIFTSDKSGKSSATVGSGFISTTPPSGTVKFTMKDNERIFNATTTEVKEDKVTFKYTGATIGTNEYISAIIKDETGNMILYAKLKAVSGMNDSNGQITFTLPTGLDKTTNTVYVFSEQINGEMHTDFASDLKSIELTDVDATITPPIANFDKYAPTDIEFEKADGTYTFNTIKNKETVLAINKDYFISGNRVIFSKEYLKTLDVATQIFTFDYGMATNPIVKINIVDGTPVTYKINATANPSEGGIITGIGTVNHGEDITLEAIESPGYTFMKWMEDGKEVSTNARLTIQNVTTNHSYIAIFKMNTTKKQTTSINPNISSESSQSTVPQTEDASKKSTYTFLLVLTLIGIISILIRKENYSSRFKDK